MVLLLLTGERSKLANSLSVTDFKGSAISRSDINVPIYGLAATNRRKKQTLLQCMDFLFRQRVLVCLFDSINICAVGVECVSVFFT